MEAKDLAGIGPYGEALKTGIEKTGDIGKIVVEKNLENAWELINSLCKPAAAEFGLLLRDKVKTIRASNLSAIADKTKAYLAITPDGPQLQAPPRLIVEVIESGSWQNDEKLQGMWAGLLASSATADGKDDSNVLFLDTLKRLTAGQARLIEYVCTKCRKGLDWHGDVQPYTIAPPYSEVQEMLGCSDRSEAKAQIGHLRMLGLVEGAGMVFQEIEAKKGESVMEKRPNLTPERLGMHFYVRCQGSRKTLREFFNVTEGYNQKEDVGERNQFFLVGS